MKATLTDLRHRMNDVLRALERNEDVSIVRRGKLVAVMKPVDDKPRMRVQDHPFFGMRKHAGKVRRRVDRLRRERYRD